MKHPLLVIVGETASGKSSLALALAEHFGGELICADSWTVYKGFDIGTAKPSAHERARVPHHLLDIADPETGFSAVEFQRQATAAIEEVHKRGKLPIMVGGTGLYIDSVLYEYQFLPAPTDGIRKELNALSLEALQAKTRENGLDTKDIDMRNKRRVIRLIENNGTRPSKSTLRSNTLIVGISLARDTLRDRITKRVDAMLAAGLEQEVAQLSQSYGWSAEPMKGIGYREWQPYFETNHQNLAQTRDRIITSTMGLAKRQRTWFKRNNQIQWLDKVKPVPDTKSGVPAAAVELVTTFLGS